MKPDQEELHTGTARLEEELAQKTAALQLAYRELEIEAALERLRSVALGMRKPDELLAICRSLFAELCALGFDRLRNAMININYDDQGFFLNYDYSARSGASLTKVPHDDPHPAVARYLNQIRKANDAFARFDVSGRELDDWKEFRRRTGQQDDPSLNGLSALYYYFYSIELGAIGISTFEPVTAEQLGLLKRFRNLFDFAYRRYMDLALAEEQTREAKIEAALEAVRARIMAMQRSDELQETARILYDQFNRLGEIPIQITIGIFREPEGEIEFRVSDRADETSPFNRPFVASIHEPTLLRKIYTAWKEKQRSTVISLTGQELLDWLTYRGALSGVRDTAVQMQDRRSVAAAFFSAGLISFSAVETPPPAIVHLLERFAGVFDLAYTRFQDLKQAEVRAREAQIEASLERVRSKTLAMQKSDELAETAAVLFRQLITLGIAPNRLYIAILQDEGNHAEFWITDEDGSKVGSAFAADLHANRSFQKMYDGWREGRQSITIDMQGEELQEYLRHLTSLHVPFKGGFSQARRVQTIAYFSKGFLGIASPDEQPEDTALLLERFAAVFNLTLTRFNDLKLAEAQAEQAHRDLLLLQAEKKRAEDALTELRATQEQLIQQEKLASLGQLTAGIAHEMKNPLNFVNNFSSVSVELVDEAIAEIGKLQSASPQAGEIAQLLNDVRANLTKVVEHGTRADGIVKSMLHHARGGTGKVESTDVNALVREYVNLAYHGMRAGKNAIAATIELDLDDSLGTTPLVAEEISRVIMNLCQNAFDAMREKAGGGDPQADAAPYVPKLTIRSRRTPRRIALVIEDNGPGIPEGLRDRVLQPFFTTKKGTQGTGLGLSIAHDIIKGHRGTLSIGSSASGGASFTIDLPAEAAR